MGKRDFNRLLCFLGMGVSLEKFSRGIIEIF